MKARSRAERQAVNAVTRGPLRRRCDAMIDIDRYCKAQVPYAPRHQHP